MKCLSQVAGIFALHIHTHSATLTLLITFAHERMKFVTGEVVPLVALPYAGAVLLGVVVVRLICTARRLSEFYNQATVWPVGVLPTASRPSTHGSWCPVTR